MAAWVLQVRTTDDGKVANRETYADLGEVVGRIQDLTDIHGPDAYKYRLHHDERAVAEHERVAGTKVYEDGKEVDPEPVR